MSSLSFVHESFGPPSKDREDASHGSSNVMPSSFEFVTFSDPNNMRNARAKSQIRKHAMKDIGALRRRPNKRKRGYVHMPLQLLDESFGESFAPPPAATSISYEGVDPFLPYPVELDYEGKRLVANLFGNSQRAFREHWFPCALMAAPIFNQALANSALQFETIGAVQVLERPAMCYHSLAITAIRQELDQQELNVTEELIASVACVISWNVIRGAAEACEVQIQGLMSLIDMYDGGLTALAKNADLRSSMSWVELRAAFMQDHVPKLPIPDVWFEEHNAVCEKDSSTAFTSPLDQKAEEHLRNGHRSQVAILCLYKDLIHYSQRVKADTSNPSVDHTALKVPIWTNIVIHKLLTLRPLESPDTEVLTRAGFAAEAFRLALLLFMAPIWRFYGTLPSDTGIMVHKLHHVLETELGRERWCPSLQPLQIWVLFMGAIEADGLEQTAVKHNFLSAINDLIPENGDVKQYAQDVLWVPGLFDAQAVALQGDLVNYRTQTIHSEKPMMNTYTGCPNK